MDQEMDGGTDPRTAPGMGRHIYADLEPEGHAQTDAPQDLTLGLGALTGIFLAVVLVCAVFFGFGYSTGRSLHTARPAVASATAAWASQAASPVNSSGANDFNAPTTTPPLATAQPASKPAAGAPLAESDAGPVGRGNAGSVSPGEEAGFPPDSQNANAPATRGVSANPARSGADEVPASAVAGLGSTPGSAPGTVSGTGGVMVQIAAVMHQADADTLAGALRSNGYAAVIRTAPQDKFLHVQVGPFATREQAKAMRARLQSDGYNAFIRP